MTRKKLVILCASLGIICLVLFGAVIFTLCKKEPTTPTNTVGTNNVSNPNENTVSESLTEDTETGDVYFETSDTVKFINQDKFEQAVPKEYVDILNNNIPGDLLDEYPDLEFATYDTETHNIYASNPDYAITLIYTDEGKYIMECMSIGDTYGD